ncbi:hypothetical protein B7R25_04615 [Subtercola boreus]|uniref:Uncharacterized protein n=1 Tax=Subtercola boreus TaxID=120213 RepID=A0A3E0WE89_9MICO|nr:hypothetical protein B7R24_04605 [Subtercola boreus]RFA22363.1 hypothetical protein B7R23_04600 [Subtercola boreus]RFA28335.1 hypothetical protein B7R25_04615 [Subtercola boreus]
MVPYVVMKVDEYPSLLSMHRTSRMRHTFERRPTTPLLRLTPFPGQVVGWSGCQCELAAFVL